MARDFPKMYDVAYTNSRGEIDYYLRGATLDRAQTVAADIEANGITISITGDNAYQGGGQLIEQVSNVRVIRSYRTGSTIRQTTSIEELLTVSASGQTLFELSQTPLPTETFTCTVNGSSTRPDVIFQVRNAKNGTPMLEISKPILATTDTVSAAYSYQNANDSIDVTDEATVESPDGSRTTYTVSHVYIPGSVTVTADVSGTVSVFEGGGTAIEVLIDGEPVINGANLAVDYTYSPDDDTAVDSSETFTWTPPSWVGTAANPPFDDREV